MFIGLIWLSGFAFVNNSDAYFHINYIYLEISIAFFLLIRLRVIVSKKSTIWKLIYECKPFETKNGNNLIEAELLLFAANPAISSLSNQSCYW